MTSRPSFPFGGFGQPPPPAASQQPPAPKFSFTSAKAAPGAAPAVGPPRTTFGKRTPEATAPSQPVAAADAPAAAAPESAPTTTSSTADAALVTAVSTSPSKASTSPEKPTGRSSDRPAFKLTGFTFSPAASVPLPSATYNAPDQDVEDTPEGRRSARAARRVKEGMSVDEITEEMLRVEPGASEKSILDLAARLYASFDKDLALSIDYVGGTKTQDAVVRIIKLFINDRFVVVALVRCLRRLYERVWEEKAVEAPSMTGLQEALNLVAQTYPTLSDTTLAIIFILQRSRVLNDKSFPFRAQQGWGVAHAIQVAFSEPWRFGADHADHALLTTHEELLQPLLNTHFSAARDPEWKQSRDAIVAALSGAYAQLGLKSPACNQFVAHLAQHNYLSLENIEVLLTALLKRPSDDKAYNGHFLYEGLVRPLHFLFLAGKVTPKESVARLLRCGLIASCSIDPDQVCLLLADSMGGFTAADRQGLLHEAVVGALLHCIEASDHKPYIRVLRRLFDDGDFNQFADFHADGYSADSYDGVNDYMSQLNLYQRSFIVHSNPK